jgi:hypothetical protein
MPDERNEEFSFNQLHRAWHQRLRQKLVCRLHGEVQREAIVKGCQIERLETLAGRIRASSAFPITRPYAPIRSAWLLEAISIPMPLGKTP